LEDARVTERGRKKEKREVWKTEARIVGTEKSVRSFKASEDRHNQTTDPSCRKRPTWEKKPEGEDARRDRGGSVIFHEGRGGKKTCNTGEVCGATGVRNQSSLSRGEKKPGSREGKSLLLLD